jgi:hypothetical protein
MRALIFSFFLFLNFTEGDAQSRFNKLYRFDSLKNNSTQFHSMRIVENAIYTGGVAAILDSIFRSQSGIFTKLDMQGNTLYNKFLGKIPTSNEVIYDVITPLSNNRFLFTAANWDSSFSIILLNRNGDLIKRKAHFPYEPTFYYSGPRSLIQLSENLFALTINESSLNTKGRVFLIDSLGNAKNTFKVESTMRVTFPLQIIQNKAKNLTVAALTFTGDAQLVTFQSTTLMQELDTAGNILWRYQTPLNRYIYGDGFVQLANSNYLMWGYEEYSRPDAVNRFRLLDSVRPFLREIKPNVGVVWERNFDMIYQPTIFDLKILKDSSIVFVGRYLDTTNVLLKQGFLIKLNKNRDSLYKRNLVHPAFSHGMAFYYPEKIEALDNGDLVIAGYAQDNKQGSPTAGQWGWLIRTDSMGCSLESTCRVPTTEVEKGPLSIKAYPNPAMDIFTVEYELETINHAEIVVTDLLGRMVVRQSIDQDKGLYTWNVANVAQGIYYVFVKNNGKIVWQTKAFILK